MIFIHTYKRADRLLEHDANHTLAYMDRKSLDNTYLFVRKEEKDEYLKVADKYGCRVVTLDVSKKGALPETRDLMLKFAKKMHFQKIVMMDDDLRLDVKSDSRTYIRMSSERTDFSEMITELLSYCSEEYPVTGITARQFSMDKIKKYDINTRIIQIMCFYLPVIEKHNLKFTGLNVLCMSDYYMVLSLLQLGYKNLCLNTYCRDDHAQTSGGCAIYRTAEVHSQSAVALYKRFPELVTLYQKDTGTWKESRINVRI